ncbi:hypothetical protein QOT17_015867 [Balamuthia mandrillaris]
MDVAASLKAFSPELPVDAREFWDSKKRCSRCRQFYTERENKDPEHYCRYHPGTWSSEKGWSCCYRGQPLASVGSTTLLYDRNAAALERHCPGCIEAYKHVEDKEFTKAILSFPFQNSTSNTRAQQLLEEQQAAEQRRRDSAKKELPAKPEEDFFYHTIQDTDTLQGLSLKYHVSREALKRVNNTSSDIQLMAMKQIRVPKSEHVKAPLPSPQQTEEQARRATFRKFKSRTECTDEEAKFYLQEAHYDLEKAMALWREDEDWEYKATHSPPPYRPH